MLANCYFDISWADWRKSVSITLLKAFCISRLKGKNVFWCQTKIWWIFWWCRTGWHVREGFCCRSIHANVAIRRMRNFFREFFRERANSKETELEPTEGQDSTNTQWFLSSREVSDLYKLPKSGQVMCSLRPQGRTSIKMEEKPNEKHT